MKVDLDRADLISLILGTGGPAGYVHPFPYLGTITGFPNEHWVWNMKALEDYSEHQLLSAYQQIKEFNITRKQ